MSQLTKQKFLSPAEVQTLRFRLESCKSPRDRVMLELALETGARPTEILSLTKASLDHETKSVLFKGLKGSNDREIPLKDEVWNRLVQHVSSIETDRLFPITRRQFYKIWTYYRPARKALRSLRHTRGIETYIKHRDVRLVQIVLGHKAITSTMVYADYVHQTQELRKLIC